VDDSGIAERPKSGDIETTRSVKQVYSQSVSQAHAVKPEHGPSATSRHAGGALQGQCHFGACNQAYISEDLGQFRRSKPRYQNPAMAAPDEKRTQKSPLTKMMREAKTSVENMRKIDRREREVHKKRKERG
jgi:hypothetical protein